MNRAPYTPAGGWWIGFLIGAAIWTLAALVVLAVA